MFKRATSIVLMLVLLPQFTGCVSVQAVNLTDVLYPGSQEIYGVVTVDGQQVDFDEPSTDVRNDSIYATVGQNPYAIALDEVQQLRVERLDQGHPVVRVLDAWAWASLWN
jgi:hypothetical protein